jgi:hypothetical protein
LEQYNYILGCKTALTERPYVAADHDKIAYILQNFKEIDPILLEQIQYYHIEEDWETRIEKEKKEQEQAEA